MMGTTNEQEQTSKPVDEGQPSQLSSQLKWFVFLWVSGVIVIACVAYGLKALMGV